MTQFISNQHTHTRTHTHTHAHKPPDNMDNGKKNGLFIMKNWNIFAQGKKGGISPPFEGVRDRDKIHNPPRIPFEARRAVDGDDALNVVNEAVKNVDQVSLPVFSRMDDEEMGNSKLSRGLKANEQNLVHVGNGIAGREMVRLSQMKKSKEEKEEEEEEEALSSSCTSYASTLSGKWPTDDEVDCVQSESPKVRRRNWFHPLPFKTWMDQESESLGTGEEDEVVEGEVSNIDDEEDEAEHPGVLMDSVQKTKDEKDVEGCKRSLDEREGQPKLPAAKVNCRGFYVKKGMIYKIIWDGDKKQRLVSDGVRCRNHSRVWDPPFPTYSSTTIPAESGAAEEENQVVEREAKDLEERKRSLDERDRQVQLQFGELLRHISVSIREEKARFTR